MVSELDWPMYYTDDELAAPQKGIGSKGSSNPNRRS